MMLLALLRACLIVLVLVALFVGGDYLHFILSN